MERDGEDQSRRQREELERVRKDETPVRRDQGERNSFLQDNIRRTEFRGFNDGRDSLPPPATLELQAIMRLAEQQRAGRRDPDERLTFFRTSIRDSEMRSKDSDTAVAPPPGDRPKNLEERYQRDAAIFKGMDGLKPDVWERASLHERAATLKETERLLAADQGRQVYRVFGLFTQTMPGESDAESFTYGLARPPEAEWIQGMDLKGKSHEQLNDMIKDRKERVIYIDNHTLEQSAAFSVRVLAEESFHAYQLEVLDRPNAHPEVDAAVREFWKKGRDEFHSFSYEDQPLEQHASAYSWRLTQDFMERKLPDQRHGEWPPRIS